MHRFLFALSLASACMFGFTGCDIDQTEEGELPKVDVDVEGGKLPAYEIEGPEIEVDTKEVEIPVPDVDVDVDVEDKTIKVPDIDIDVPDDKGEEPGEDNA